MEKRKPKGQKIIENLIYVTWIISLCFTSIDGLSSAIQFFTLKIALKGTSVVLLLFIASFFLPTFNWKLKSGEIVKITKIGSKPRLALLGIALALWIPLFFGNDTDTNPNQDSKKIFKPIFRYNDSTSFNVLIIRFEDYIADKNTFCIGRSIEENLLVAKENDSILSLLNVNYVSDSIPPPKSTDQAEQIKDRHNADLVIYGLATNIKENCEGADVCFRYNLNKGLVDKAKPAIEIKSTKFDLEFTNTTPTKISLGQVSIDFLSLNNWISSLCKLKFGDKEQAFLELDKRAMDTTISKKERSERYFEIGNTYHSLDELNKAITSYDSSIYHNSKNYKALHNRAASYLMTDQNDKAKFDIDLCIANNSPDSHSPHYLKGLLLKDEKKYPRAIQSFRLAISRDPSNSNYFTSLAETYILKNQPAEAINTYRSALFCKDADSVQIYTRIAEAYNSQKMIKEAREYRNKSIFLNPKYPHDYVSRGLNKIEKEDYYSAIEDFDMAIELDPLNTNAYYYCGYVYDKLRSPELALQEYDKLVNMFPKDFIALTLRGGMHDKLGNSNKALTDFSTALEINPKYGEAYSRRGWVYMGLGKYDLAMRDYNKSLNLNPNSLAFKMRKLFLLFRLCDFKEAHDILSNLSQSEKESQLGYGLIQIFNRLLEDEKYVNSQLRNTMR